MLLGRGRLAAGASRPAGMRSGAEASSARSVLLRGAAAAPASAAHSRAARRRGALAVRAALQARGTAFPAEAITVKRVLGEGSYGQVFEVRESGARACMFRPPS